MGHARRAVFMIKVFRLSLAVIAGLLLSSPVMGQNEQQVPGAWGELPDACMDNQGNVHLVWVVPDGAFTVHYARYDAGSGQWSSPTDLPYGGECWAELGRPKVEVGPNCRPHVVWGVWGLAYFDYAQAQNSEGSQWWVTQVGDDWRAHIDLAVDQQDQAHFVFGRVTDGPVWRAIYLDPYGNETEIAAGYNDQTKPAYPQIKVGPGGTVHVSFLKNFAGGADVYYANSDEGFAHHQMSYNPYQWYASFPRLAISPVTGKASMVFFTFNLEPDPDVIAGVFYAEQDWNQSIQLFGCGASSTDYMWYPQIEYDGAGTRYVVWTLYDYYTTYYKIGDNDDVELPSPGEPTVAAGPAGAMMIRVKGNPDGQLWWQWLEQGQVYYPPTAQIDGIDPDTAYTYVDDVEFYGSAWDNDEGGASIVAYEWSSNLDGVLSQAENFSMPASSLSLGTHTITFRAQDNEGDWGQDTGTLVVLSGDAPPASITDLEAFDTPEDQGGSISLTWTRSADDGAGADDVESYRLERRESQHGLQFDTIAELPPGAESYSDTTSQDGELYYYRVVAIDAAGQETPSAVAGPVTSADDWVTPPSGLAAADVPDDQGGALDLTWTLSAEDGAGVDDVVEYRVMRAASGDTAYSLVATVSAGTQAYTDETVDNAVLYSYVVRAVDDDGNLGDSSPASATPHDNIAPGVVPNLKGMCIGLEGWVFLSWDPSPDDTTGAEDVVNYRLRRKSAQGASYQLIATIEPNDEGEYYYVDQTTASGARYYYLVRAFDGENVSDDSDIIEILVTPAADGPGTAAPDRLVLADVNPNPVKDVLQVTYGLPRTAEVSLTLRNVRGQTVATIDQGMRQAGYHTATCRLHDGSGLVGSGMTFVVFESGGARFVRRVIVAQ
jgi:hypothetical protein